MEEGKEVNEGVRAPLPELAESVHTVAVRSREMIQAAISKCCG